MQMFLKIGMEHPKSFVEDKLIVEKDVIFDIDWQGAQKLSNFSKNDVVSIFILPPSNRELLKRLKRRAEDSIDIVSNRMSKAKSEISHWIEYDYVLINDTLKKCSLKIMNIISRKTQKNPTKINF